MSVSKLRKPDWLAEMQAVVLVGLIGTILFMGLDFALPVLDGKPVTAAIPMEDVGGDPARASELPDGVTIPADALVEVRIADPSTHQLVASGLTSLPTMFVVLGVLALLWHLLRHARRGDPFTGGTVRRLRVLGILTVVGGTLAGVVETIATLDLVHTVTGDTGTAMYDFPFLWLLAGFGFLAIAELVRRGTVMRDELEAVV